MNTGHLFHLFRGNHMALQGGKQRSKAPLIKFSTDQIDRNTECPPLVGEEHGPLVSFVSKQPYILSWWKQRSKTPLKMFSTDPILHIGFLGETRPATRMDTREKGGCQGGYEKGRPEWLYCISSTPKG